MEEVQALIDVLVDIQFVVRERGYLRLNGPGQRIARQPATEANRGLLLALLRAGYFYDQARILLEIGHSQADGALTCPIRDAKHACPQLVGALEHWPDVNSRPVLRLPHHLVQELGAVWALLPPGTDVEASERLRKSVGNRGELYSYQLERLQAEIASDIVWVARDDETLGYDIEDRSCEPRRHVEVKASGDSVVRFFLSRNEWKKVHEESGRYEIQFWGQVDLNLNPAEEFSKLRGKGYPLIFSDLPAMLESGAFQAEPYSWLVTERGPALGAASQVPREDELGP